MHAKPCICQICKKALATIHLTDIHNNVKKEVHLCESCAREKGFDLKTAANLPQILGLAAKKGLIQGAGPNPAPAVQERKGDGDDPACPECGTTWNQFNERGRLGCPRDYQAFGDRLRRLVAGQLPPRVAPGGAFHVGKSPGAIPDSAAALGRGIRSLERRLREAAAEEKYEEAAALKSELDRLRHSLPEEN
ncbi:MAG: UvrB/UvrC motif-containing protein [Planctomycetota bacterium]|jgi:protein arginine kinase activator|nr:UvrB/UvrC motif-containing protein [Planctomycetota bacterium]